MRNDRAAAAAATACFAAVLLLTVYPVGRLVFRALTTADGVWTLDNLRAALAVPRLREGLFNTLLLSALSSVGAIAVGGTLAALAARTDAWARPWIKPLALAPYLVPPIVASLAWIVLADGHGGLLNAALAAAGLGARFEIFSMGGMVFVGVLLGAPVAFLILHEALSGLDGDLEDQARVCGAAEFGVWRRIVLPLLAPSLAAAALLCALQFSAQFGVHAPIGMPANVWTLTTLIYSATMVGPIDLGQASAMSLLLVAVGLVLLALQRTLLVRAAPRAAGRPPRRLALGWWALPGAFFIAAYAVVVLLLPYGALLMRSLRPFNIHAGMTAAAATGGWSLAAWRELAGDGTASRALIHSLLLGAATAAGSCLLGAVGGWVIFRGRIPRQGGVMGRGLLHAAFVSMSAFSGVVLGLAVLLAFGGAPFWLYGSWGILLIAYLAREAATGLAAVEGPLRRVSREFDDAARVCGAGAVNAARRLWWPYLRPSLAAGAALAFIASFREVGASSLLYGYGREVVGSLLIIVWHDGRYQKLSALALASGLAAIAAVALIHRVVRDPDVSRPR